MATIIAYNNNNPTMKYDNTVWLAPLTSHVASYRSGQTTMAGKYEQEWRCCKCQQVYDYWDNTWWRHQMETFSAWLAICAGNSPVPGEFPAQRPVTRSFDVFLDLRLNKRLSKQSRCWWFEMPSRPLWRHNSVNTRCDVWSAKSR